MIRVRTVTDAHGTKRVEIKARAKYMSDIIVETATLIEDVNRTITANIKEGDAQIYARSRYAEILGHLYKEIADQCKTETEMYRDAQAALKDDIEADLAERILNSERPEEK